MEEVYWVVTIFLGKRFDSNYGIIAEKSFFSENLPKSFFEMLADVTKAQIGAHWGIESFFVIH